MEWYKISVFNLWKCWYLLILNFSDCFKKEAKFMKVMLLGIAFLLFGLCISTGNFFGFVFGALGLMISIAGMFTGTTK